MRIHRRTTQLWLPQPRDKIFEFFADPGNLERLTPDWLRFEILTKTPVNMRQGVLLDYRLRIHGFPIRWQSEIAAWNPPRQFIDRQIKGPYRLWIHEHTFIEDRGGTLIGDNVRYAVPGGIVVQRLLVARDLKRIFNYRHQILQTLFNARNEPAE
jgi:ligand-binding SRPBCC domain-containing protein